MDDVNLFLVEWVKRYIENKDVIRKEILNIEKQEKYLVAHCKDRIKHFFIKSVLDSSIFDVLEKDKCIGIFTLNNKSNIRFVINNWNKLVEFERLRVYFVNPFSNSDKVWTVNPHIHNSICDKSSLDVGIKSMSSVVEFIDEHLLQQKLNQK